MNKYSENSADQSDYLSSKELSPEPKKNSSSWWQGLVQTWDNIPIQAKITTLLITCATIPVIAVTQGIVEFARRDALNSLKNTLNTELALLQQEIDIQKQDLEANANALALSVQAADINLENTEAVAANGQKLQSFIASVRAQQPKASFYIITDAKGDRKSVV